jgi:Chaperone required for the assembly of the mitochondrial F1-ATPase
MSEQLEIPEFYIDEHEQGWCVLVGERPVKTPAGNSLVVPDPHLADIIICELHASIADKAPPGIASKLINTVIDRAAQDRPTWITSSSMQLLEDSLFIRVPEPQALRQLQDEHAKPFMQHGGQLLGSLPPPSYSLSFPKPGEAALCAAESFLCGLDDFSLLAFLGMAERCRSFLMAYGHLQGPCGIQEVGDYLLAEEIWQERLWGEDPEALDRRRNMLDDLASFSRIALLASQKQPK